MLIKCLRYPGKMLKVKAAGCKKRLSVLVKANVEVRKIAER